MKWFVLNGVTLLDLTLQVLFWAVLVVIVIVVAAVLLIRWDRKKVGARRKEIQEQEQRDFKL